MEKASWQSCLQILDRVWRNMLTEDKLSWLRPTSTICHRLTVKTSSSYKVSKFHMILEYLFGHFCFQLSIGAKIIKIDQEMRQL